MDKYFKTEDGKRVHLVEHCREVLGTHPAAQILIGTDSQSGKKTTKYATVVVFRYGTRGAHYVYSVANFTKIRDIFSRLFKECELSLEIAEYITHNTSYRVAAIELDFNDFSVTKSTPLISATKGWCESLGYKAVLKSGEMIACKAADHVVRDKGKRKKQ